LFITDTVAPFVFFSVYFGGTSLENWQNTRSNHKEQQQQGSPALFSVQKKNHKEQWFIT
jgi:hypothetical protein